MKSKQLEENIIIETIFEIHIPIIKYNLFRYKYIKKEVKKNIN